MYLTRREFLAVMGAAWAAGLAPGRTAAADANSLYDVPQFGNVRLLHITDVHAQLLPVYFREPNVNLGVHKAHGRAPHLVGQHLLEWADIDSERLRHAYTYLDFSAAARRFGKVGGFAHLSTLIKRLRADYPESNLLLDGGDTWQGSGSALWTRGRDMLGACNLLGVDVMTGHWEFTYRDREVLANLQEFKGDFVAQNVHVTAEGLFEDMPVHDEDTGHAFPPYTIKEIAGHRLAVIGQAFPYTPIANPARFIPFWTFGVRDGEMQKLVDRLREEEKVDAVVVLSHNGMDVDLKMASRVSGIDAILGGHTHDAMPSPVLVDNPGGRTIVTNAGSHGKFLAVLDLDLKKGGVAGYRYRLLPVFANLLEADPEMASYIDGVRAPYRDQLSEELAVADRLLYRRGNFNGTFDQLICDAQRVVGDAQIALSPGFRWGTTVLPGQTITMEHVLDQTAITYPETYVREMTGEELKLILEDVCDNLFNPDPYYQQGGDMVRVGGMDYVCDPTKEIHHRISDLTLDDGTPIDPNKKYKVAGWATVGSQAEGAPIWDVVAEYLRDQGTVTLAKLNTPKLKNVSGNPGIEDYLA